MTTEGSIVQMTAGSPTSPTEKTTKSIKTTKPKAKRNSIPPEEKEFVKITRLIFSSFSGRGCQYAYFNIRPNGLIMANATSPSPNKTHGDRIMAFKIGVLGLQMMDIIHSTWYKDIRRLLCIPETGYYLVYAAKVASILGRNRVGQLHLLYDRKGNTYLAPKETQAVDKQWLVMSELTNHHIAYNLLQWNAAADYVNTDEFLQKYPHQIVPVTNLPVATSRVYYQTVEVSDFRHPDGSVVFPDKQKTLRVSGWEGIHIPHMREYLSKQDGKYRLEWVLWSIDDFYIRTAIRYRDDVVSVLCLRPNNIYIPLPADLALETGNLCS